MTEWLNGRFGRLAVTQVVQVDSRGVGGIQIADLLVGAVVYDCRLANGIIQNPSPHKLAFVEALRRHVGVENFSSPYRDDRFNIAFHGQEPFRRQRT